MEEKRKEKRLHLDVTVELERIDSDDMTTVKLIHVETTNLSKSGIGFRSKQKLEKNTIYNLKLQIWTKEVIEAVIKIIRCDEREDGYEYGALFIGMLDTDAMKIDIYQIFNDYRESIN